MQLFACAIFVIQASTLSIHKSSTQLLTDPVDNEYEPDEQGRCMGRLRCIKVNNLPGNYCFETNQVNWCQNYTGQPACIQANNYDTWITKHGRDSLEVECSKTRGHSTFPSNDVNWSPTCKDNTMAGLCPTWNTGGNDKCPICGATAGQDGGAAADNDVIGGMR